MRGASCDLGGMGGNAVKIGLVVPVGTLVFDADTDELPYRLRQMIALLKEQAIDFDALPPDCAQAAFTTGSGSTTSRQNASGIPITVTSGPNH